MAIKASVRPESGLEYLQQVTQSAQFQFEHDTSNFIFYWYKENIYW